jgi:hypothetical protein
MKALFRVGAVTLSLSLLSMLFGATVTLSPNEVPKNAYVNGSDGNQHFIQLLTIVLTGGYASDAADNIVIDLPTDMTVIR